MSRDSDREFMDTAFDVARRFRAFDSYGGKEATAILALMKRSKGRNPTACVEAFETCVALYDAALDVADLNEKALWREHKATNEFPDMAPYDGLMRSRVPGADPVLSRQVMTWVFYWHHLR